MVVTSEALSTMYSECSSFYPNRFTFGGVIAERVNTAKLRPKVTHYSAKAISFSRIKTCIKYNGLALSLKP